tara:strand:- start:831 stop:1490 length:660 start_codon:yes stop_codon:yes gene_type:complete
VNTSNQIKTLLLVAALVFLVVVGLYVYQFGRNGLSTDPGDWASFGSYIGGALGPFVAVLGLYGAWITIQQQRKIQRDTNAYNLIAILQKYEFEIDEMLRNQKLSVQAPNLDDDIDTDLYEILTNMQYWNIAQSVVLPPDTASLKKDSNNCLAIDDYRVQHILCFSKATGHLKVLRGLVAEHGALSGNNSMEDYYHTKYDGMIKNLSRSQYPIDVWSKSV